MPEVLASTTINRPVMAVYSIVVDPSRATEWQPDVTSVHTTETRLRVGAMITQERSTRLLGWKLDLNADVVEATPNRLLEMKGVLGRFSTVDRIEFESTGGTTVVTEQVTIRLGFPWFIVSPLMRGTMKRRTQKALDQLKVVAEGG
jgi:uncharacterized protein YndB with AHSA1/START domain